MLKRKLTWVACEGDEQVRFPEVPYDGHGVKISLHHVSGATCETGGQHCGSSANVAGVITTLQGIAESAALVIAQVVLVVALIL